MHDAQLDAIYIFTDNKCRHKELVKEWFKVIIIHTEIASLCKELQKTSKQCDQDSKWISYVPHNHNTFNQNLNQWYASPILLV